MYPKQLHLLFSNRRYKINLRGIDVSKQNKLNKVSKQNKLNKVSKQNKLNETKQVKLNRSTK